MFMPGLFILALFLAGVLCSCIKTDFEEKAKVETGAITGILAREVQAEGTIIDLGEGITDHGHCWSEQPVPTIISEKTSQGNATVVGQYYSQVTGLKPGAKYYIRSWAKSREDILYGKEVEFTTLDGGASIATSEVKDINIYVAKSGGIVTNDGGSAILAKGVCWSISPEPTIADNKTTDGNGLGSFSSNISGLLLNTTYYLRAYATNEVRTSYGEQVTFNNLIYDKDGNHYNAVVIGNQIWLNKNLKTTKYNNGDAIPKVIGNTEWKNVTSGAYSWYDNEISNKEIYGGLYNWYTVNTGKLCPFGWHVPSILEWEQLVSYVGGGDIAGDKLKTTTGWAMNGNGTDSYGFHGLPGGFRELGNFVEINYIGEWWSTNEWVEWLTAKTLLFYYEGIGIPVGTPKNYGLSVRCVRDN